MTVKLFNNEELNVPKEYKDISREEEIKAYRRLLGYKNDSTAAIVYIAPIAIEDAILKEEKESVINGIHASILDTDGIISVDEGITKENREYIYTLIKRIGKDNLHTGVQYMLTMHIQYESYALDIHAYFEEAGITGIRDSVIYMELNMPPMDTWQCDPYDNEFKQGIPMNQSELEKYDSMFPKHPLTKCREFIREIIEEN